MDDAPPRWPASPGLRGAGLGSAGPDLLAGLTVWAVLVPEALAYATIAGVPPVVGLYAAPAALALYAVVGSSRHLVVGPMAATAALSAAVVGAHTSDPATAIVLTSALALVVGGVATIAGLLRLGFVAAFISEPVLEGFILGLAATIVAGQVPKLVGLHSVHGSFVQRVTETIRHLGDVHGPSVVVGALCLGTMLLLRRVARRVPAPLVVIAGAIVAATIFDLDERGVAVVGDITSGLPTIGLPDASWSDYGALTAGAVGIALIGFAEGLAAARADAAATGDRIDPDRELLGLGTANLGAGLSAGMVVAGSLSKTAVNASAGARTQVSGLAVAGLTVTTLLFLTGWFEDLPEAALAAVVIAAVIELLDLSALRRLSRVHSAVPGRARGPAGRPDLFAALAAMVGVLVLDTLPGLFLGIAVSAVLLVYRASRPHVAVLGAMPDGRWADVDRHPDAVPHPGVVVVRPEAGLFYGNAGPVDDAIRDAVDRAPGRVHTVVVDAGSIPMIDVTAADTLARLGRDLARTGIALSIAGDIGQVRDVLRQADGELAPASHPTVEAAIDAHRATDPGDG